MQQQRVKVSAEIPSHAQMLIIIRKVEKHSSVRMYLRCIWIFF